LGGRRRELFREPVASSFACFAGAGSCQMPWTTYELNSRLSLQLCSRALRGKSALGGDVAQSAPILQQHHGATNKVRAPIHTQRSSAGVPAMAAAVGQAPPGSPIDWSRFQRTASMTILRTITAIHPGHRIFFLFFFRGAPARSVLLIISKRFPFGRGGVDNRPASVLWFSPGPSGPAHPQGAARPSGASPSADL